PGAIVQQLERVRGQVVTVQAGATQPFDPSGFDRDDGRARSEKPIDVLGARVTSRVKRHARAFARHEVIPQARVVDRPDGRTVDAPRRARLEARDAARVADVEEHHGLSTHSTPASSVAALMPRFWPAVPAFEMWWLRNSNTRHGPAGRF